MTPFEVRRERFHEFCLLLIRLQDKNARDGKKPKKSDIERVPAGDDWF